MLSKYLLACVALLGTSVSAIHSSTTRTTQPHPTGVRSNNKPSTGVTVSSYHNSTVAKPPPKPANSTVVSSTSGHRKVGVNKAPDRAVFTSINTDTNSTTVVSFTKSDYLRFGIEWHRNGSILDGSRSDIAFAVRLIGLYEVNATYPSPQNRVGKKYILHDDNFHWGNLAISDASVAPNSTARLFLATVTGTHPDGFTVTASMHVSTDTFNTTAGAVVRPTGVKFDLDTSGHPVYLMTPASASTWRFNVALYSSTNFTSLTGNTFMDAAQSFDWVPWIIADGVNTSMSLADANVASYDPISFRNKSGSDNRENLIDSQCRRQVMSFALPHFAKNFSLDPSLFVSETQALTMSRDGSLSTTGSGTPSAARSNVGSSMMLSLIVFAVAMINIL
eukprot:jgi/Hompol1/5574/HPOL_000426-RA